MKRKGQAPEPVILINQQSPGDIVMLTATVRDLHRAHPGRYQVVVRTSAPALWENNPYVAGSLPDASKAREIQCRYPLINRSNQGPWHFIHGFHQHLAGELEVAIPPTDFRGDIHISELERGWMSQVQEITRIPVPFWIVAAGGKYDYTAKWWPQERYQEVVDYFAGRLLFVQVGAREHHHPPLRGVLDLRGKTDLRQLVRLVYHSQGVLCPVTLLMHLAAAVPVRHGPRGSRPCVVVAGGREPPQWEAYPAHQFVHTCGALTCCAHGGCWKSRVVPLGDGDQKDSPEQMCVNVTHLRQRRLSFERAQAEPVPRHAQADYPGRVLADFTPRCMDLITAAEVIRRIELYLDGGMARPLSAVERRTVRHALKNHHQQPAKNHNQK